MSDLEKDRGIPAVNDRFDMSGMLIKISFGAVIALISYIYLSGDSDADPVATVGYNAEPYATGYQALPSENDAIDGLYKQKKDIYLSSDEFSFDFFGRSVKKAVGGKPNTEIVNLNDIMPSKKESSNGSQVVSGRHSSVDPSVATSNKMQGSAADNELLKRWAAPPIEAGVGSVGGSGPGQDFNDSYSSTFSELDGIERQLAMMGNSPNVNMFPEFGNESDLSSSEKFAKKVNDAIVETAIAMPVGNTEYKILQGKIIRATLESAINTDLPGRIRAITSNDVYGDSGRTILIPKGSRIIGEYNNDIKNGQTRVFVMWPRLIRPDGIDIAIGSASVDNIGRSGIAGEIETHFFKRFGSAALMSIIGVGVSANANAPVLSPAANYKNQLANAFQSTAGRELNRNSNIPDTHSTDQGATILIFVSHDLDFNAALNKSYRPGAK